jgi:hypothetical protein
MRFVRKYVKTIYGCMVVDAKNSKDAQKEFEYGKYDEFDNKSEYTFDDWEVM